MYRRSTLSKPDAPFLALANGINEQCTEHATEWGLSPTRLSTLNTLTQKANTTYAANNDRPTRNLITTANKRAAFNELKHFLGPFIDYLESNLDVPDDALAYMGLRSRTRHAHEPLAAPTEAPVVSITARHGEIVVYVARPEHGHPTHSARMRNYHGFKLRWRFEGETEDRTELSTRLRHTLRFHRDDEGKRVVLAAAWVNPRLEAAPWSEDRPIVVS
jgi:hypothetical protein